MTEHLDVEDLLTLAADLGVGPVRDLGLLDSAAHRPTATLWGREVYPSLEEKAAALLESVVRNHALVDGNKRLGWLAAVVFLDINGRRLEAPDDDAYALVMAVAGGRCSLKEITGALAAWASRGTWIGLGAWTSAMATVPCRAAAPGVWGGPYRGGAGRTAPWG